MSIPVSEILEEDYPLKCDNCSLEIKTPSDGQLEGEYISCLDEDCLSDLIWRSKYRYDRDFDYSDLYSD